jgi:hypothetical protein
MARGLVALLALACVPTAGAAATLYAEPIPENDYYSEFQIAFADTNGNRLVDFAEIVSFSGVYQDEFAGQYPRYQPYLQSMPQIDGFTTAGAIAGIYAVPGFWMFSGDSGTELQTLYGSDQWTYRLDFGLGVTPGPIEPPISPVPLPAAAGLMAAALAGLVAARARPAAGRPRPRPERDLPA